MIPRKLHSVTDRELVIEHLTNLQDEDRRLRFGGVVTDEYIITYVENSWYNEYSQWFGCTSRGHLISACHVSIHNGEAELGCSVSKLFRGHGLAQAMFDRAITYLRAHGITNVYMHCLTENEVMRHIARKNDMTIVSCCGETDAKVEVDPPTPMTAYRDAYLDKIAIYDMLIRTQSELYGSWLESFKHGKTQNLIK